MATGCLAGLGTFLLGPIGLLLGLLLILAPQQQPGPGPVPPTFFTVEAKTPDVTSTPMVLIAAVVSLEDIPCGTKIDTNTLARRKFALSEVPADTIVDINQVIGRYARSDIPADAPITESMLADNLAAIQCPADN
jgi:flagella basal body P-ring formation protein FlgA